MKNLNKLFDPQSIAIVGASPKKDKLGYILANNIKASGWKGKLFFVNPKHRKIGNARCFKSLEEINKPVDLALIAIPAEFVAGTLKMGATIKYPINNYVVISAGFKEVGEAGKKLEEELKDTAETWKLNILGPNCLGFINTASKLNATFTSSRLKRGKIAIVSQSGALEVALLDWAEKNNLGFSKVISIGNKAVLDESDLIKFLNKDKSTNAIALYLEDIKDGAKYINAASDVNCLKPLIVIKAGKTKLGQKAISSHTGSLAQDEKIIQAVAEKFGIIMAETLEQFQDIISYLEYNSIPKTKEVIIVTNAGGPGVLAADLIGKAENLKLLEIDEKTKKLISKVLPQSASVENPIDILGDASPERYKQVLEILSQKFYKHPLIAILTPQNQTHPRDVAKILGAYRKRFGSLSACFMGGVKIDQAESILSGENISNFASPERALTALEKIISNSNCSKIISVDKPEKAIHLKLKSNAIIQGAKKKLLEWHDTEIIFKEYGISLAKTILLEKDSEIRKIKIKFPCVVKTNDSKISHRWDKKGVILGIKNSDELKRAIKKLESITDSRKFIVQEMQKNGLELIIGMKRDKSFGPVLIAGFGGTLTEIFKDSVILIPPLTEAEIARELSKLLINPILKGFRGEKGYKIKEISTILLALQRIAIENSGINEIDINPLIMYNNSRKPELVDVKVFISQNKK